MIGRGPRHSLRRLLILPLVLLWFWPAGVFAQSLSDYTAYPPFLSQTVARNILFIADLGDSTLQAAYSGPNHHYPVSFRNGTATDNTYASNVTFTASGGRGLASVNLGGATITAATTAAPSDTFDATMTYYGYFDPQRCYVTDSNSFNYGAVKTTVADACASTMWDGNFLNWLAVRKKDAVFQALIGGTTSPAQANVDGTANSLSGEAKTGLDASNNTCNDNSKTCWRFVKFVPDATLAGRVPSTLPTPFVAGTNVLDGTPADAGRFFGVGEGQLFVNDNGTPDPFDATASNQYALRVDLATEPDIPAGTGLPTDHCIKDQPGFAGHLVCYKRERSLGILQKMKSAQKRAALMFVNAASGKAGRMVLHFDAPLDNSTLLSIRGEPVDKNSPLSEALYEGLCLYRKSQGPCYNNDGKAAAGYDTSTGVAGDPFYVADLNQTVECCASAVILLSPGFGLGDGKNPDGPKPFGDLLGGANLGVVSSEGAGDRLDDVAYYGHVNDVRDQAAAAPVGLAGTQDVTFYAVNTMGLGAGATLLASAAKYGGFVDQNSNGLPDAGGQACTYPAGSSLGSGPGTSSAEWDHDRDCVPDNYFEASQSQTLEQQLSTVVAAILQDSASGSAASLLTSSSTGEGALFQSFFYPRVYEGLREVGWVGYVQSLFIDPFGNLREDSDADGRLVYDQDLIVRTRVDPVSGEVVVDKFADVDGDGLADSTTPVATASLRQVQAIWEAGARLAMTDSCSRTILTWVDQDNDRLVDLGERIQFSATCAGLPDNSATLAPYLNAEASPLYTATNIINFVRGDHLAALRDRRLTVGGSLRVWKLGDAIHSQPVAVGPPAQRFDVLYGDPSYSAFVSQYRSRRHVVYVGANDGMLHGFNAGFFHRGNDPATPGVEHGWFTRTPTDNSGGPLLGQELFGFIPQELLPQLKWLTRPDYTHVYYVDLKPKVMDARIFTPDADHPNGWGTVLIGGFRMGGSCAACTAGSGAPPMQLTADFNGDGDTIDPGDTRTFYSGYFVLDVTNPESADYPKLLWSFSIADLGLSTGIPSILRVSPTNSAMTDNTDARWYMVVGSGPTGYDGSVAQGGSMFAIDLEAGPGVNNSQVQVLPAEPLSAFFSDTVALDRDFDYRVDVAYAGGAIDDGTPPWRGKLYRLTTNGCTLTPCAPSTWGIADGSGNRVPSELLDLFPATGALELGPVTAPPAVAIDDSNKVWVFAGTGRYLDAADKTDTALQYILGVKDSVMSGLCTQTTRTNCHDQDLVDVSAAEVCLVGIGDCGTTTSQVTGVGSATDFPSLIALVASQDGWFTTLPAIGERVLVRPRALAGLVFFPSFAPTNGACAVTGNASFYALHYMTGTAHHVPILGTTSSGANEIVKRSTTLGESLHADAAVHVGQGGFRQPRLLMQTAAGAITELTLRAAQPLISRVRTWYYHRG